MVPTRSQTIPAPRRQYRATPTTADDLRRLVAGNSEEGWRSFDEEFRPRLTRFAFALVRDQDRAHEMTQETFQRWFRVFTQNPELEPQTPIMGWLLVTCRRIVIDEARRPSPIEFDEAVADCAGGSPRQQHEMRILFRIDSRACREKLTSRQRFVLGRVEDGWTVRELAEEMGWNRGGIHRLAVASKQQVLDCLLSRSWTEQEIRGALA